MISRSLIFVLLFFATLLIASCTKIDPNKETKTQIRAENTLPVDETNASYQVEKEVYVPVYSDIYSDSKDLKILLTATLSVRNTSRADTLYVNKIDYYDTSGEIVRSFLESPIFLRPLETVDYVIERDDTSGGTGANFTIYWAANNSKLHPIFQAVMIGSQGNTAFSFITNGVVVNEAYK